MLGKLTALPRKVLASTALVAIVAAGGLLSGERAGAAAGWITTEGIRLGAAVSYEPRVLPRHGFAPLRIRGRLAIASRASGLDNPLERMEVNIARNRLRIDSRGLGACPAARLEATGPGQARRRCRGALVARGQVTAGVEPEGGGVLRVSSPLSVFNGLPQDGRPTILIHAHTSVPAPETYLVSTPLILRRGNRGGLHFALEIPEIAGGRGYLSAASIDAARIWRHRGRRHTYIGGRCLGGSLPASGRFDFARGTVIEGILDDPCRVRR